MTKVQLALASLVAAIPGGILVVLLVLTFLNQADSLTGTAWAVSIITLLASATAMLTPVGILLFGPKTEKEEAEEDQEEETAESAQESEEILEQADEMEHEQMESEPDMFVGEGDELPVDAEGQTQAFQPEIDEDLFMEDVQQADQDDETELELEVDELQIDEDDEDEK